MLVKSAANMAILVVLNIAVDLLSNLGNGISQWQYHVAINRFKASTSGPRVVFKHA